MKKLKYKIIGISILILGGFTFFASAQVIPFTSKQLAPSPSNGKCLVSNGNKNSWNDCGSGGGGVGTSTNPFMATYFVATSTEATSQFAGITTNSEVDPYDYNCAGTNATTTTGSILISSNSLTVNSASGWRVGMGIAIPGAGTSDTNELVTTITNISGTTFTLADSTTAGAIGVIIYHDDTSCLQRVVDSGKNPHLRLGNYNVTSAISITKPQIFRCEGGVNNLPRVSPEDTFTGGSVIWNRGKTNDTIKLKSSYTTIEQCSINQDPLVTPTAGWGINIGSSTYQVGMPKILFNVVYGTYGGIAITGKVVPAYIGGNLFWSLGGVGNLAAAMYIDNDSPAGDIKWIGNEFRMINPGLTGYIVSADVEQFTDNKFNNNTNPALIIDTNGGGGGNHIDAQSFVNCSFEGSTGLTSPLIHINGNSSGISFIGGEIGTDFGYGGILIQDNVTRVSVVGVNFSAMTGDPITNTSTGSRNFQFLGNIQPVAETGSSTLKSLPNSTIGYRLGIGTSTPSADLDIFTINGATGQTTSSFQLQAAKYGYRFEGGLTQGAGALFRIIRMADSNIEEIGRISDKSFSFGTTSPSARFRVWGEGTGATQLFELDNNASTTIAKFLDNGTGYFLGNIGIGTTTPWRTLSVNGSSDLGNNALAGYFTATTSTASIFPYASTTALSAITLCLTGDLPCRSTWPSSGGSGNVSTSSVPVVGQLAYWTTTTATPALLSTVATSSETCTSPLSCTGFNVVGNGGGAISLGTVGVANGGTGQTSFGQGWLHTDGTTFTSSTSPTVNYIYATSTTATSTFQGGINVAGFVRIGTNTVNAANAVSILHLINNSSVQNTMLKLQNISGAVAGTVDIGFIDSNSGAAGDAARIGMTRTNRTQSGDTTLDFWTSGTGAFTEKLTIRDDGNLGIGTTSPFAKLSITGVATLIPFAISTTTSTSASTTLFMIDKAGDVHYGGGTPILSSCGTGPSLDANSTDQSGTVTFGASASACTITFSVVKASSPHCIVTAQSLSLTNALTYTETATALTLTEASSGGLKFDYFCPLGH